jgi:hypothetical protein
MCYGSDAFGELFAVRFEKRFPFVVWEERFEDI